MLSAVVTARCLEDHRNRGQRGVVKESSEKLHADLTLSYVGVTVAV